MNKVLITGHRGFIGQHLTEYFDKLGINWIGYDLQEGDDIRDLYRLDQIFRENGIKQVIHLAARAGVRVSQEYYEEYITTNVLGTQNVIHCCEKNKVEHLIFFSSSSVYGSQPSPNSEMDVLKPESTYAVTKVAGELLVKNSSIKSCIIRPFTVYGENGRKDQVIFKWINQIKRGDLVTAFGLEKETKRGYTYVGDLIDGVVKVLDLAATGVYNLGGSEIVTLKGLLDIFKEELGDKVNVWNLELPAGDVSENWADISKAMADIGFKPMTDFEEKVKEIIKKEI